MARTGGRRNARTLSLDERTAIVTLIQYHIITAAQNGDPPTHGEIGAAAPGLATYFAARLDAVGNDPAKRFAELRKLAAPVVSNVIAKGAQQGASELIDYYRELTKQSDGPFSNAPRHIQAAMSVLYPQQEDDFAIETVFSHLRHKDLKDRKILGDNFEGIWDIIRYSAHQVHNRDDQDVNVVPVEGDPWVVRAGMQVGPMEGAHREPWFRLHYKPRGDGAEPRIATGSLMLINGGAHIHVTGWEHDYRAPIYVIADFVRSPRRDRFVGLVVRRHSKGRMLASRVAFIRSNAKTLEELAPKIDVFRESHVREKFANDINDVKWCLEVAVNRIANGGKAVLLL